MPESAKRKHNQEKTIIETPIIVNCNISKEENLLEFLCSLKPHRVALVVSRPGTDEAKSLLGMVLNLNLPFS